MQLAHLRLPGLTKYLKVASIQDQLVQRFLAHKASSRRATAPPPAIITTEFYPVYTCGRREVGSISPSQEAHLRANGAAAFHTALRGGQTTFHGPGQLVAYPILDLKWHGLTARSYVELLEECVIQTCLRHGIGSFRTTNPGVWTSQDDKICALGVHLRRNITSHGIGLNICTDLKWFDRIVACGLEGKRTMSFYKMGVLNTTVNEVAYTFVDEMRQALGLSEAITVHEDDLLEDPSIEEPKKALE